MPFGVERVKGEGWLVSIRGEHELTTAPMLSQTFERYSRRGRSWYRRRFGGDEQGHTVSRW
jgi:hypothetical protein